MTTTIRRCAAFAAAAVLVLGACSGDDSSSDADNGPSVTDTAATGDGNGTSGDNGGDNDDGDAPDTTTTTLAPSAVVSVAVNPGVSEGFEGARSDVDDLRCEQVGDEWVVGGDVTNSVDVLVSYRIYTSFLDANRVTVGLLQVDADGVEPGETREWEGRVDLSTPDLDCILRVERTRLGS